VRVLIIDHVTNGQVRSLVGIFSLNTIILLHFLKEPDVRSGIWKADLPQLLNLLVIAGEGLAGLLFKGASVQSRFEITGVLLVLLSDDRRALLEGVLTLPIEVSIR